MKTALLGVKFVEFLEQTSEGEKIRKELEKDFITWQKKELGLPSSKQKLMTVKQFMAKMFPENLKAEKKLINKKRKKRLKQSKENKKKKEAAKKSAPQRSLKFKNT